MIARDPKGLFETTNKVGMIFPVLKKNGKCELTPTECHNDCRGENIALELQERNDFVAWAIDPWTSIVNLTWDKKA